MKDMKQTIKTIKDKARIQRAIAYHHLKHDPEPQQADVMTTVFERLRWEVQS